MLGILRIFASSVWPIFLYQSLKTIGTSSKGTILIHVIAVAFLLVAAAVSHHFQSKINIGILSKFTVELSSRIWKKMNALDWLTFHGKNRVYYFDMLLIETWRVRNGLVAILESLIVNALIALILSIFIGFVSMPLFFICLAGLVIMGATHILATIQTRPFVKKFHDAWRVQHHWISKCVDQFDLLKMDRAYQESLNAHRNNTEEFVAVNSKLLLTQARWRNVNQLVANMVRIAVFMIGIYWVKIEYIGLDGLLLTLLVVSIVQGNISQVTGSMAGIMEAQESLKTIALFLRLKEEKPVESTEVIPPLTKISIRGLSYGYHDTLVVKNVDLDLQSGNIYLWQGANGSGKTTVAHILMGLIEPEQGTLKINDQPANWATLKSLRKRFAYLNQDSPVFMGDIKENALFGHPEPELAWEGLQSSWLHRLLPGKHAEGTRRVGERGEGLSGGESKRVAFIRELLRSSEILILDEPLNHLDEYVIREIEREIVNIKAKTIVIIISHQSGFERIADEIRQF
ncbi:ATP-binding cassette domain-containing protein [Dyadobacter aurulentus]|uniref:ATP-binding cassette domain-containing protein n=1 Tax=Dyadobacter sp. UC 10 TaxID=2605428 RepID=UPI001788C73B|nr:ABC transporter ATP-binding protein [Dyadobacter sp. UC 10]